MSDTPHFTATISKTLRQKMWGQLHPAKKGLWLALLKQLQYRSALSNYYASNASVFGTPPQSDEGTTNVKDPNGVEVARTYTTLDPLTNTWSEHWIHMKPSQVRKQTEEFTWSRSAATDEWLNDRCALQLAGETVYKQCTSNFVYGALPPGDPPAPPSSGITRKTFDIFNNFPNGQVLRGVLFREIIDGSSPSHWYDNFALFHNYYLPDGNITVSVKPRTTTFTSLKGFLDQMRADSDQAVIANNGDLSYAYNFVANEIVQNPWQHVTGC